MRYPEEVWSNCKHKLESRPGHDYEVVAGLGHAAQAHDLHRLTWQGLLQLPASWIPHAADSAPLQSNGNIVTHLHQS